MPAISSETMTNLIIHPDTTIRRSYLLDLINSLLESEYSQISQLYTNPDIHIIEQPEHVSIKIEDVKMFQKEMQYKPFNSKYQIGVIFHARSMTKEAQNALLKTLEEQSSSTVYFLLVNNEKSVLPTIVSRSVKHYVTAHEHISGGEEEDVIEKPEILLMDLISQFDLIEQVVEMEKESKGSVDALLNELSKYYRGVLLDAISSSSMDELKHTKSLISHIEIARERNGANVNKRLLLENLILKINSENDIM